jgi:hypothetical protein
VADARRFLALSSTVFTDPLLWGGREYSHLEAAIDIAGMASFASRVFEEQGVRLDLEVRETRPLSVRFLMKRWGWKSTATVARFLSSLETRSGTLTKHRTTRLGNTYLVGCRLLTRCGETSNETPNETGSETPSETKSVEVKKNSKNTSLPTGERRARGSRKVPKDWQPTPAEEAELRSIAAQRGADYGAEMEMLRDHEFPRTYTDWVAVARNWMRRAAAVHISNGNGKRHDAESWRVRREGDGRGTEDDPAFNFPIPEF